jgi:hypothetical protein
MTCSTVCLTQRTVSVHRADAARRHLAAAEPDVALHIRDLCALVALHQPLLHVLGERLQGPSAERGRQPDGSGEDHV